MSVQSNDDLDALNLAVYNLQPISFEVFNFGWRGWFYDFHALQVHEWSWICTCTVPNLSWCTFLYKYTKILVKILRDFFIRSCRREEVSEKLKRLKKPLTTKVVHLLATYGWLIQHCPIDPGLGLTFTWLWSSTWLRTPIIIKSGRWRWPPMSHLASPGSLKKNIVCWKARWRNVFPKNMQTSAIAWNIFSSLVRSFPYTTFFLLSLFFVQNSSRLSQRFSRSLRACGIIT